MVTKDLVGKFKRFIKGRLSARRDAKGVGIPESCLHHYLAEGSKTLAVFYSGDGGWARLTTHLSMRLQQAGISVAGIDCMHYFWKEKHPEQAARDLELLIREQKAEKVILLGYSMGADVLPTIVRCLPVDILAKVGHMVLMSPSYHVQLKFRFIGWLGFHSKKHLSAPLLPDIEFLAAHFSISCFAGKNEQDTLARDLPPDIVHTEFLPGGHHYRSDYETLADRIFAAKDK
jgi:type IV secretory pathway VirJ component